MNMNDMFLRCEHLICIGICTLIDQEFFFHSVSMICLCKIGTAPEECLSFPCKKKK